MKTCKHCGKELPLEKKRNTFCDKSCSASFNNKGVRRHGKSPEIEFKCVVCGKECVGSRKNKGLYCSTKCQKTKVYESYIELWKKGKTDGSISNGTRVSKHIRRYLFDKFGGRFAREIYNIFR